MDWTFVVLVVTATAAVLAFKRAGQMGMASAVASVKAGARVVDVRSPSEFARDRVEGAVNLPLPELEERAPQLFPSKDQVLLVHCLSGGRSLLAARQLRQMGYRAVHNLGSLGRARTIVERAKR